SQALAVQLIMSISMFIKSGSLVVLFVLCQPGDSTPRPDECTDGEYERMDCNGCWCANGYWMCTMMLCLDDSFVSLSNELTHSAPPVSKISDRECDDGESKILDCNQCRCMGGLWACTMMRCLLEPEERSILRSSCPNYKFIDKHVCSTCVTAADALQFSKEHRGEPAPRRVSRNTVFEGQDITYTAGNYNNEDTCRLTTHVKTWNCYHDRKGTWTHCKEMGHCTAQSAMVNGHFFHQSLNCL
ncbi:unnamed protein product, partial [Meganyctiphanes norvegica]